MPFTQNNVLVQAFFSRAAHPALRIGVEVGRPRWQLNYLAPARPGKSVEFLAELAIAVVKNKPGQAVMLKGENAQLLNHPLRLRMLRDVAQHEVPTAQLHKEQNVERPQSSGGDGEEIGGPDKVFVLAQELRPGWGSPMVRWRSQRVTPEQADHRAATYLQSQLQHLPLNPSRSPMRILPSEANDQVLDLLS